MDRRDTRLLHVGLLPSKEGKIDVDFDKNSGVVGGGGVHVGSYAPSSHTSAPF